MKLVIRSGGQTGADRAALDYAVRFSHPYLGWCPQGGRAEDYSTPPGLLAVYPKLTETPSSDSKQRTAWNVRDSHATLILVRANELSQSLGTVFTKTIAELVFVRPCLVVDMLDETAHQAAKRWLMNLANAFGRQEIILNIAGPRETNAPGIYESALSFLKILVKAVEGEVK